jgi:hypothetical protein
MMAPVPAPMAPPRPTPFSVFDIDEQPHASRAGKTAALTNGIVFIVVTPEE